MTAHHVYELNVVDVTDPADPRLDDFRDLNSVDRRPDLPSGTGLVLAEGSAYVERAPWTALGPAGALVLVSVLSVGATAVLTTRRSGRATPTAA